MAYFEETSPGCYLDASEQKDTDLCHPGEIRLLEATLDKYKTLNKSSVLDAGCGDGRFLTFFASLYNHVDCFDWSSAAVVKVEDKIRNYRIGHRVRVEKATFASCTAQEEKGYDLIFLCHAVGYMTDAELVPMLLKAKGYLTGKDDARATRSKKANKSAAICVLESLGQVGTTYEHKGQRIRPVKALSEIFEQAGLTIVGESESTIVHQAYLPVKVWLLA